MVLKKSKSSLNSGATQRGITHKGMHRLEIIAARRYTFFSRSIQNILRFTPKITASSEQAMKSMSACIENVYNYLGLETRNICTHNNKLGHAPTLQTKDYSLDKGNMWLLPGRIRNMMTDVDFITCITQDVGLNFTEIQDNIMEKSLDKLKTKVTSASEIIAKSKENSQQKENTKASRTRHTSHKRGVQRLHLLTKQQKQKSEQQPVHEEQNEEQLGSLELSLHLPFGIEARSVSYDRIEKRFGEVCNTSKVKSSTKIRGRNKNKIPCRHGYCNSDLKYDTEAGLDVIYADDSDISFSNNNKENHITCGSTQLQRNYCITDFITNSNLRSKRKTTKKNISNIEQGDVQDCANSNDRIRYSKGSFIVAPKEESQLWNMVLSDEVNVMESTTKFSNLDNDQEIHKPILKQDDECNISEDEQAGIHKLTTFNNRWQELIEFDDGFVQVHLVLSKDQEEWISSSNGNSKSELMYDNGYTISTGPSFPPCFVVDFSSKEMHRSNDKWRFIIGRKRGLDGSCWLVSLQDRWLTLAQAKQQLEQRIAESQVTSFSLSNFIKMVEGLDNVGTVDDLHVCDNKPIPEKWMSSYSVWRNMPQKVYQTTDICSAEEACQKLQADKGSHTNISDVITTSESLDKQKLTECNICYMDYDYSGIATSPIVLCPCLHNYCIKCWREHIQHSSRNGANIITCMETRCTNVMDMITASTIVPYSLLSNWKNQFISRSIDSSPNCSWCPNIVCKKVAVSRDGPMRSQFGKLVICECKFCWCSGCHKDPHWPASCDQNAVYKKLLAKTKMDIMFENDDINFEVEAKKCPNCQYPIEKNSGCPSMYCIMCNYAFCWNCMKETYTHRTCIGLQSSKTTTYVLSNKRELNLPLKFFDNCLTIQRKSKAIQDIKPWLEQLRCRASFSRLSWKFQYAEDIYVSTKVAALHAEKCVHFLKQVYTLQETMYVLSDFANLSKCKTSKTFVGRVICKIGRLDFIASRIETILGKSLLHVCKCNEMITFLLPIGQKIMAELSLVAPVLQNLSKDVETSWIGELDPNTMRYK